ATVRRGWAAARGSTVEDPSASVPREAARVPEGRARGRRAARAAVGRGRGAGAALAEAAAATVGRRGTPGPAVDRPAAPVAVDAARVAEAGARLRGAARRRVAGGRGVPALAEAAAAAVGRRRARPALERVVAPVTVPAAAVAEIGARPRR